MIYLHLFFVVVLFLINEWEGARFVFYSGWIWSHLIFSCTLRYVLMEVFVKDIGVVWSCFVQVVFEPPHHHYDCLRSGFVCHQITTVDCLSDLFLPSIWFWESYARFNIYGIVDYFCDLFLGFGGSIVFALRSGVSDLKFKIFALLLCLLRVLGVEWWFKRVVV